MNDTTPVRLTHFSFDEFSIIKEILLEWQFDWIQYDLIHSSDSDKVDVTFHLDTNALSVSEFIHLLFSIGQESVFSGRVK
ncbi:conserved hypothetical protein [Tenacibaculum sp. 190524A05c]|uniref:hypothetical protein n=1 Tax=Tenacibaculum platacis TaxID=3137852 RepID=UPI0031FA9EF4